MITAETGAEGVSSSGVVAGGGAKIDESCKVGAVSALSVYDFDSRLAKTIPGVAVVDFRVADEEVLVAGLAFADEAVVPAADEETFSLSFFFCFEGSLNRRRSLSERCVS